MIHSFQVPDRWYYGPLSSAPEIVLAVALAGNGTGAGDQPVVGAFQAGQFRTPFWIRTEQLLTDQIHRTLCYGSHSPTLPSSIVSVPLSALTGPKPKNANIRLLACLVDEDDTDDSDYGFLCDRHDVKYVSTAPGTFCGAEDERTFEPILLSELLPPFPIGDWNKGHVAKDPETSEATFIKTEKVHLAGVENLWHPARLNESDFTQQERVRQRVHISTHPELNDGKPVVIKLAVWPWEITSMRVETTAYQWMHDSGIGPRFFGHLTEGKNGRVVGFVVEWVQGARSAGSGDIESCKKALGRLHGLGIKLGDINKHNFLVRDGHDVMLVDFETTKHECSPQELDDEMSALKSSLEDATS